MGESIPSLLSDTETTVVETRFVVIYAPKRGSRKRFAENCVTVYASEAEARAAARPAEGFYAAVASGPSRSSEGFRLFYLVRWLDA